MELRRLALSIAGVPLLSSCMMGSVAHTEPPGTVGLAEDTQASVPLQYAEAGSEDLTITLSFPTPRSGSAITMDARLATANGPQELMDGEISLRIQTPSGRVDPIRMRRFSSPTTAAYEAMYDFRTPGLYVVTAEGRAQTGAGVREASVTITVPVSGQPQYVDSANHRNSMMPMALMGLSMVAMMVVMMAN
jgi:hypothetical protein